MKIRVLNISEQKLCFVMHEYIQLLNPVGAGSGIQGDNLALPFFWIQLKVVHSQDILKHLWWAKLLGHQSESIEMTRH